MKSFLCVAVLAAICFSQIDAHGMLISPPMRSTRWRYDDSAPKNYNDNALLCGTFPVQSEHGGKCGLCGDSYALPTPRPNELGGTYGQGVIVRTATKGETITATVRIVQNHKGYFQFHLCNLDQYAGESEDCFNRQPLRLADGSDKFNLPEGNREFDVKVVLPAGVTCRHCVFRWTYIAGNRYGACGNGSSAMGCGPQETYRNCADIRIN